MTLRAPFPCCGHPRITDAAKGHAVSLRDQGASLAEIAAAVGCSVSHAHRITTRRDGR